MCNTSTVAALGALILLSAAPAFGAALERSAAGLGTSELLQTWDKALDGTAADGKDTPVTRVVNLLKEMSKTLDADMEKDEALYKEMSCWCNNGKYEKTEAIKASTAKIEELQATIESLTAGSSEVGTTIKELEAEYASDKQALDEAKALREKQLAEFHDMEKDSIQALENLKAAITVLSKHQGPENAPGSSVAGGAVFKTERDSWSLMQTHSRDFPWAASHESRDARSLDNFMLSNGFGSEDAVSAGTERSVSQHKFLQQNKAAAQSKSGAALSDQEAAIVKRAMKSVSAFVQSHQTSGYFPAYNSQSGEIFGVLKQLKEQMEGELSEAQKAEQERAANFAELRAAKEAELADGYKMSEQKEDAHAKTDNNLAEAKEDLEQEQNILAADQEFLKNLENMCAEASKNFDLRKKARLSEMQAVAETIEILQGDEARDAMSGTYNSFVQMSSSSHSTVRSQAAETLRRQARRLHSPQLSILATSVELDSFTKVKKAIDDMIGMLKVQQEDEVKKNDWCKDELHENDMSTSRKTDKKADLEAAIAELESTIKGQSDAIVAAKSEIAELQLELQRATEDRQKENLEFQRTIADQTMTVEVLKKALDRLATHYDLLQTEGAGAAKGRQSQTPPVPQMEYKPSKGAGGVMEMIEKLIHEANGLKADSKKSESEAQAAYEQTVADTNASVAGLQKQIVSLTKARAGAEKDKRLAESDHADTVKELEGLAKYNAELHGDCDYLLKNFGVRQNGRQEEIEALQQAKQILSGAALS